MYSQRHRSAMTSMSEFSLSPAMAFCTTPSFSYAPLPQESLCEGTPNTRTEFTPLSCMPAAMSW